MDSYWSSVFLPMINPASCRSERERRTSGRSILLPIQICLATPSFEKSRQLGKTIRRKGESPIPVPQTHSAFHPHAQRNAFRRRDVHQQRSLFARENRSLRHSSNSNRLC